MATDVADSTEKRQKVRPRHLKYVEELLTEGRILIAGPFPAIDSPDPGPAGMSGSLIVAEFDTLADAKAWVASDPYVLEGVFDAVTVKPFRKVLP